MLRVGGDVLRAGWCVFGVVPLLLAAGACRRGASDNAEPQRGIALSLAETRARAIRDVRYELSFTIPPASSEPIAGHEVLRFALRDTSQPLIIDFDPGAGRVPWMLVDGKPARFHLANGHIVVPAEDLKAGDNAVEIAFRAGDASLNRNPDFLYTLFVPARAHLAFPCFDQPDLKARFTLDLTVPDAWATVANGAERSREAAGASVHVTYAETPPIPTYLFAFAAGMFKIETAERDGRTFRMFHRETDATKVARNRDAVFDLHAASLQWLQQYTAIPYAFGKFDFVAIPSFQFGGMEHPGAIFYNAASILLDQSATENQLLNRANTIAHETTHMWFGDLVTMRWFNDVWMKEVFANFMAAKIVNPSFPHVNHELRFLVSNYPAAYDVDRTAGTHPIRQELANLDEAGTLYGAIIYEKAPIVMRQLERLVGAGAFQKGLRAYLDRFKFGNATWLDLVRVLGERSSANVAVWSHAWVEEAGRPSVTSDVDVGPDGRLRRLAFVQADPQPGRSLRWPQKMEVAAGDPAAVRLLPVDLEGERVDVRTDAVPAPIKFVLTNGGGLAYGDFTLDPATRAFLIAHVGELKDPLTRGATWVTLWEEMLDGRVTTAEWVDAAIRAIPDEDTEQNVQLVVGYLSQAFWKFLPVASRPAVAPRLEAMLRGGLARATASSLKSTYFFAFRSIVTTSDGIGFLHRVWHHDEKVPGLTLAEPDEATMALELAVRCTAGLACPGGRAESVLEAQRQRFQNPDRKARFEFVMPALAERQATRDAFFRSLRDVKNRRREPWVTEGLRYLNHPLRAADSEQYVGPALDLLPEIQQTGDIFFPKNWLDATLFGHTTRTTAELVRRFLAEHRDYPLRLRRIVLQSADDVFRATRG